ncbi:MAG: hypothetical protein R3C58_11425 [Parvularculaceae bacterium]
MRDGARNAVDQRDGEDRRQIFGMKVFVARGRDCRIELPDARVTAQLAALSRNAFAIGGQASPAIALSISGVSAAPQTPVRRILELTTISTAFAMSARDPHGPMAVAVK